MPRCSGFKQDGSPCERIVSASQSYCFAHDPSKAEERSRNASRAGKRRPSREIASLKNEIRDYVKAVHKGELDRNDARAMFDGYKVLVALLRLERDVLLEDEITAKLEELERGIGSPHSA